MESVRKDVREASGTAQEGLRDVLVDSLPSHLLEAPRCHIYLTRAKCSPEDRRAMDEIAAR